MKKSSQTLKQQKKETVGVSLRMTRELRAKVAKMAKANFRSLTQQVLLFCEVGVNTAETGTKKETE